MLGLQFVGNRRAAAPRAVKKPSTTGKKIVFTKNKKIEVTGDSAPTSLRFFK